MTKYCQSIRLTTGLFVAIAGPTGASAQSAVPAAHGVATPVTAGAGGRSGGISEVVVTAEKRSTNLQKTPISITAISGAALKKAQIHSLLDLKGIVPAMQMGEVAGYAQITVRGIGIAAFVPGADSAVALNMNDVYVSRPIAQLTGLYDLSSVEVLRGPQGTLFGRNATAGAINLTSARPTDDVSGFGRVAFGNFASVNAEGAISGPIIGDVLTYRLAGYLDKHDGYGKNVTTGNPVDDKDAYAFRGTLVYKPTPDFKATLIGEYYHEKDNGAALHYMGPAGLINLPGTSGLPILSVQQGGYVTNNMQDTATPMDSKFYLRTEAVTGILEWSNGPFSLKSITGYRDQNSLTLTPLGDGSTPNGFDLTGEPANQVSEELQAHYNTRRLHATMGLYYFHENDASIPGVVPFLKSTIDRGFGIPFAAPDYYVDFVEYGGKLHTTAKAAFAQASYEVIDGLTLTAGIRYSEERASADLTNSFSLTAPWTPQTPPPPVDYVNSASFSSATPKFGIEYQLTPRTMLYASYSKGFKSGGFDITVIAPAYQPEKVTDYEAGFKTTLLDNRLRLNLGGFYYDYTNLQVAEVIGTTAITTNAATAKIYGSEAEITYAPTDSFTLNFGGSWLHARYTQYFGPSEVQAALPGVDFSGRALDNAPDFSGHSDATYTWQLEKGSLALRGEVEFATRAFFSPDNVDLVSQGAYAKENAFLTYAANAGWGVTAFARNIGNKDTWVSGQVSDGLLGFPAHGAVAAPRTFGAELSYKF